MAEMHSSICSSDALLGEVSGGMCFWYLDDLQHWCDASAPSNQVDALGLALMPNVRVGAAAIVGEQPTRPFHLHLLPHLQVVQPGGHLAPLQRMQPPQQSAVAVFAGHAQLRLKHCKTV